MGRGMVCVVVSAITIIIMFITMVVLMTTINPPPLPIDEPSELSKDQMPKMGVPLKHKFTNMFFNDGILPAVYNAQYGSEKIDADEIDFYQTRPGPHLESPVYNNMENFTDVFRFSTRNVIPPLWPRVTQTIIIEPSMHVVVPPIWPTSSLTIEPAPSSISTTPTDVIDYRFDTRKPGTKSNILVNKTLVKPMKRRSISNNKIDDYVGSVILKILDNDGRSRIEIKLGSDNHFQKTQLKRIGKGHRKSKSKFTLRTGFNKLPKNVELAKDTVIAVMPNDSVVIDELEGKTERDISDITNITDLINSIIFAAPTKEKYKEINVTEFEESVLQMKSQNEMNNTVEVYEDINLKALYNNDTKSSGHIASNSSYLDIVNRRKTSILNDTINIAASKNKTDFDTMLNTKINHTEFDKIIFDEEETNNITPDTTIYKPDNNSIVTNDSVSNNVFIENDGDSIVY